MNELNLSHVLRRLPDRPLHDLDRVCEAVPGQPLDSLFERGRKESALTVGARVVAHRAHLYCYQLVSSDFTSII